MNLTPLDDVLDKHFGKVGTPKRDAFESDVDEALHAYRLGEAIKKARIEQNLTQEQLGERIGVKRAQISRLERGYSITIPTMRKVFKALGVVTATIDLGIAGKVALWEVVDCIRLLFWLKLFKKKDGFYAAPLSNSVIFFLYAHI